MNVFVKEEILKICQSDNGLNLSQIADNLSPYYYWADILQALAESIRENSIFVTKGGEFWLAHPAPVEDTDNLIDRSLQSLADLWAGPTRAINALITPVASSPLPVAVCDTASGSEFDILLDDRLMSLYQVMAKELPAQQLGKFVEHLNEISALRPSNPNRMKFIQ